MQRNYNLDLNPATTHTLLLDEIPNNSKVLEIGTASGYLGKYLVEQKNCEVWGVEPVSDLYNDALSCGYKKLINKTAEEFIEGVDIEINSADIVFLGDVLEHMVSPEKVLLGLKKYLKPGGKFVISMPNIAHYSIRLHLLGGKWEMADAGILDRTHLRFFTRDSAVQMLESCGLTVEKVRPACGEIERFGLNKLKQIGKRALFFWPRLLAYQFIFVARKK